MEEVAIATAATRGIVFFIIAANSLMSMKNVLIEDSMGRSNGAILLLYQQD
jgi:hypothetical protein